MTKQELYELAKKAHFYYTNELNTPNSKVFGIAFTPYKLPDGRGSSIHPSTKKIADFAYAKGAISKVPLRQYFHNNKDVHCEAILQTSLKKVSPQIVEDKIIHCIKNTEFKGYRVNLGRIIVDFTLFSPQFILNMFAYLMDNISDRDNPSWRKALQDLLLKEDLRKTKNYKKSKLGTILEEAEEVGATPQVEDLGIELADISTQPHTHDSYSRDYKRLQSEYHDLIRYERASRKSMSPEDYRALEAKINHVRRNMKSYEDYFERHRSREKVRSGRVTSKSAQINYVIADPAPKMASSTTTTSWYDMALAKASAKASKNFNIQNITPDKPVDGGTEKEW